MEKIEVQGSSVDFFKSIENNLTTYFFDTSKCAPPEPMVNAMAGLQLLDENSQLVMINHKSPAGLFPRIEQEFDFDVQNIENGLIKVIFRKKIDAQNTTDYTQNSCGGSECNH